VGGKDKKKSGFSKTRNDRQNFRPIYVISEVEFIVNKSVTIASLVSVLLSRVSSNFNKTSHILVGKSFVFGCQNKEREGRNHQMTYLSILVYISKIWRSTFINSQRAPKGIHGLDEKPFCCVPGNEFLFTTYTHTHINWWVGKHLLRPD